MTQPTRMTPEDSAFWRMESQTRLMHSVTLAVFAGPAPDFGDLRDHVARRVQSVPRFRQRVIEIPLDLGRPMWVDDPSFTLDDHLVETVVPGPTGLTELVSLIVSTQLDRSRPLWELTFVTGLDDRWAIVSKVHHSMIDGLWGTEPLAVLVDEASSASFDVQRWSPDPIPGRDRLVTQTLAELLLNPGEQYRFLRAGARRSRRQWEAMLGRRPAPDAPPDATGLRGPVGDSRAWSSLVVPLGTMRAARRRYGVSLHQLILGLVTTGLRDLLISRDESAADWPAVKAIVPVAVADSVAGFRGGVAAEIVELPVTEPDLAGRLDRLQRQTRTLASAPATIDAQVGVAGFAAPALASLGLREATRRGFTEKAAHTVILNVPGPRQQLSVLDRSLLEIHPVTPLAGGVRVSVGVFSYRDTVTFGVTTDRRSVPDVQVVTTGLRRALSELDERQKETDDADR